MAGEGSLARAVPSRRRRERKIIARADREKECMVAVFGLQNGWRPWIGGLAGNLSENISGSPYTQEQIKWVALI